MDIEVESLNSLNALALDLAMPLVQMLCLYDRRMIAADEIERDRIQWARNQEIYRICAEWISSFQNQAKH